MIKGIPYVQCQKWVIKLSLKDKHFWVFYVTWIELVLFKEDGETLFRHNIFTFLINEQKEFRKSIKQILTKKILMVCTDEELKHLTLMVNELHANSLW